MAVFGCAGCGAVLTRVVSEVALPIQLADTHWETLHPPLLEAGSYAVDPAPFGPPWRQWDEVGAPEAADRGRFAPFGALSNGPSDTVLLAPGDMRGTRLDPFPPSPNPRLVSHELLALPLDEGATPRPPPNSAWRSGPPEPFSHGASFQSVAATLSGV